MMLVPLFDFELKVLVSAGCCHYVLRSHVRYRLPYLIIASVGTFYSRYKVTLEVKVHTNYYLNHVRVRQRVQIQVQVQVQVPFFPDDISQKGKENEETEDKGDMPAPHRTNGKETLAERTPVAAIEIHCTSTCTPSMKSQPRRYLCASTGSAPSLSLPHLQARTPKRAPVRNCVPLSNEI